MHGLPTILEILPLITDESRCREFLLNIGAFYDSQTCSVCNSEMKYYPSIDSFVCPKKICRKKVSAKKNTFFSKHNLPCSKIIHLAYLWLAQTPIISTIIQTGHSSHTVCNFFQYFRELVSSFSEQEECQIGGPGIIVEIDECKLGKRKNNRGHHVEGVWILGGVERTEDKKTFFVKVQDRSAQTLLPLIARYVAPGSIVHTDLWRGYSQISQQLDMLHFTVNHSVTFIDPNTGCHTNTIEGTWNGLKLCISARNRIRDGIETFFGEFQWRRLNSDRLWDGFFECLKETHYD
jgi:hypothetical protein